LTGTEPLTTVDPSKLLPGEKEGPIGHPHLGAEVPLKVLVAEARAAPLDAAEPQGVISAREAAADLEFRNTGTVEYWQMI
jgi:hypothetical protein